MPLPRTPRAVIFDMDGLLLDTERVYREAIFDTCDRLGFPMTDDLMHLMIGVPWDTNRVQLAEAYGAAFPFDAYLDGTLARFGEICTAGVPLRPGALELLQHLEAIAMPIALATSSGRTTAEDHLTSAGVRSFFETLVTRDDVERGKPHPEPFLKAARHLDVEPALCLALEDSHNGVRAASSAGMMTVMVPDLLEATPEIEALCTHIAADLHEVRGILERLG